MKGSYLYEEPEANWDCVSLKKIFDFTKNNQKYCDAVLIVSLKICILILIYKILSSLKKKKVSFVFIEQS